MIIGIDISQIVYSTGVSRYTKELVKNLLRIDKKNHYKLFAGVWRQKQQIELFAEQLRDEGLEFELFIKPIPPQIANKLWNKFHIFPVEKIIGNCDIFHCSDWTVPPTQKALKITTIHDLTPILFPQSHDQKVIVNFSQNLKLARKECVKFIAVSKSTKKDLTKLTSISADKIEVVYEASADIFIPKSDQVIKKVKQKYGIGKDYILSVGTIEPRKNINSLIKAFKKLNDPNIQLVMVGKYGWGKKNPEIRNQCSEVRSQKSEIIETGFVDDEDLPALYSGAKVFIYPSLYEGFGLPVLEAMSCGTAVITSNRSSLPEIMGFAGILVNPKDINDIAQNIKKIIYDEKLAKQLSEKGLIQAKNFSWEKTARETLKIYESVFSNK